MPDGTPTAPNLALVARARIRGDAPNASLWSGVFGKESLPLLSPFPLLVEIPGAELYYRLDVLGLPEETRGRLLEALAKRYDVSTATVRDDMLQAGCWPLAAAEIEVDIATGPSSVDAAPELSLEQADALPNATHFATPARLESAPRSVHRVDLREALLLCDPDGKPTTWKRPSDNVPHLVLFTTPARAFAYGASLGDPDLALHVRLDVSWGFLQRAARDGWGILMDPLYQEGQLTWRLLDRVAPYARDACCEERP
jgi:hypothetical protein